MSRDSENNKDNLERGKDKVERAIDAYRLFFKDANFDLKNYCITETL
jgi:hypothetical protein